MKNRLGWIAGLVGLTALVAGVTFAGWHNGAQPNPELTKKVLKAKGYTAVQTLGTRWVGCPREFVGFVGEKFKATTPQGQSLEGFACCWEKSQDCIIRTN
jgi:hypothetical protein